MRVVTETCHVVSKQLVVSGHCYVMLNGLMDCHLVTKSLNPLKE